MCGAFDAIWLWDADTGENVATFGEHCTYVHWVVFRPDRKAIALGTGDENSELWDVVNHTRIATLTGHTDEVHSVAFSREGMLLASGSPDTTVRLWDVVSGSSVATLSGHIAPVVAVAFSPNTVQSSMTIDSRNRRVGCGNSRCV